MNRSAHLGNKSGVKSGVKLGVIIELFTSVKGNYALVVVVVVVVKNIEKKSSWVLFSTDFVDI